ncbi:MAG: GNAT family N-acetyltransferase [Oscillospiraceae bacterium]|nr:GNAT family N-acetyltransferase [Oscillospiraceae bacterium]
MNIIYNDTKKDLPVEQLHHLFYSADWTSTETSQEDPNILKNFNIPFINSTLVISAWENERLIGAVRVLSDKFIRSVIYDLVVDPKYRNMGIAKELVSQCIKHFPNSEWLVQTEKHISAFYERIGFNIYSDVVLTIPSIYQRGE